MEEDKELDNFLLALRDYARDCEITGMANDSNPDEIMYAFCGGWSAHKKVIEAFIAKKILANAKVVTIEEIKELLNQ